MAAAARTSLTGAEASKGLPASACDAGAGRRAPVEAGDEVAQLLAEARAHGGAGAAVALLVRQVLRQLLHQRVAPALQQDHQVCSRQEDVMPQSTLTPYTPCIQVLKILAAFSTLVTCRY